MLAWLRERLVQSPDGIHAIVVADLVEHRGALERALAAALQPERELPRGAGDDRVFDLAGGDSLASQSIVDAALAAIACTAGPVDWIVAQSAPPKRRISPDREPSGPRGSPPTSRCERNRARRKRPGACSRRAPSKAGAAVFAASLQAAAAAFAGARRRSPAAWAEAFGACLAAWGWPGEIPPGSRPYQAARHFRELLAGAGLAFGRRAGSRRGGGAG